MKYIYHKALIFIQNKKRAPVASLSFVAGGVDTGKRTGVANAIIRELKITEIENLLTLSFEVYCIL
jgi:hypothetical protein